MVLVIVLNFKVRYLNLFPSPEFTNCICYYFTINCSKQKAGGNHCNQLFHWWWSSLMVRQVNN